MRNQPQFAIVDGKGGFQSGLHKASGYIYAVTSFLKGITASMLAIYSHSLGFSRPFMITYGLYDCLSVLVAMYYVLVNRDLKLHRK